MAFVDQRKYWYVSVEEGTGSMFYTLLPRYLEVAKLGGAGSGNTATRLSKADISMDLGQGLGTALRPLGQPFREGLCHRARIGEQG